MTLFGNQRILVIDMAVYHIIRTTPPGTALLLAVSGSTLHARDNTETPVRLEEMTVTAAYPPRQTEDTVTPFEAPGGPCG